MFTLSVVARQGCEQFRAFSSGAWCLDPDLRHGNNLEYDFQSIQISFQIRELRRRQSPGTGVESAKRKTNVFLDLFHTHLHGHTISSAS